MPTSRLARLDRLERRIADCQRACLVRVVVHVTGGTVSEALEAIRDTSVRFALATNAPEPVRAGTPESRGEAFEEAMAEATAKFEAMDCLATCGSLKVCYARLPFILFA